MTVSYGSNVAQTSFIGILRLLLRWKGSAWKNASIELLIWSLLYAVVSIIYRTDWFLTEYQKDVFENIKYELKERRLHAHVTLVFFLGFFAKTAATRWLNIMENMGYIERHAHIIGSYVQGDDEHARLMRRAMVRWMCLAQVLVFRDLSVRTRKRYPDMESIIKAGSAQW
ncbi:hypothetical protein AB6A40_010453 [Gnathostoma spinigerum]|uniref:Bestrophin homolog n=1 Tax=Gnathostoma spinigerum TaxID=75299 RepID=A0ABD6EUU7_9BILA